MGLVIRNLGQRWPGGCVPFTVDTTNLDPVREQAITDAIGEWEAKTGFRFVRREKHENFVRFAEQARGVNAGGSSAVGMRGGQQIVNLKDDSVPGASTATVIHEIGHALGLAHEQQRADRNDKITIHRDKFSGDNATFDANYSILSDSVWKRIGDHDLCSIMHYGTGFGRDRNVITVDDVSVPCSATMGQGNALSNGDLESAKELLGARGEVVRMSNSGQFQNTAAQIDFSAGWNVLAAYMILNVQYVFMLKTSSGRTRIRRVEGDGRLSEPIFDADWSPGWTHAVPYSVGTGNFLLLYKRGAGDVHVHELKHDGTIGARILDTKLDKHFSSFAPYNILVSNYLFMIKESNGTARVVRIESNGHIGEEVDAHNWSSGWTSALSYRVGSDNFLFLLKDADGTAHVHRLTAEGKVGERVQTADLNGRCSLAIWLPITLSNYVLVVNGDSGRVETFPVGGDGRIGDRCDVRQLRGGIRALATYGAWAGRYLLMTR